MVGDVISVADARGRQRDNLSVLTGACAINLTNPTWNLTSGIDQQVTMKWEYYRCVNGTLIFPIIGVNGPYKYPANDSSLTSNQCVLVSS